MALSDKGRNARHTFQDYLSWPEGERWELIDGIPYMRSAPSRIHQEVSVELLTLFNDYLKDKGCRIYHAPFTVCLIDDEKDKKDAKTIVEPDLTIVCDYSKLDDKGCIGAPDMIIEILSPSSAKKDRLEKFNKYEKAGVREYWIVEPEEKLVSVFVLGENNRYGRPEVYSEENSIKVGIFDSLIIDLKTVFNF